MSDSSILIFHDKVLKIQDDNDEAQNERYMLRWLQNWLPVPEDFAYEVWNGKSWLLMERCDGKMACDSYYMEHPSEQIRLLAQGIVNLWNVDIAFCPSDQRLKKKLESARYHVEHGLVDMDNVEPTTFGKGGFPNPSALLQWLYDNQPEEEPVLSHGDFCLPNLFFYGVAWLRDEPGVRDMCILEAPEEEGIYIAEIDMDLLRDYREHEVMGEKYRHPKKYGAITEYEEQCERLFMAIINRRSKYHV